MMDKLTDHSAFTLLQILLRGAATTFLKFSLQRDRQHTSTMTEYIQLSAGLYHKAGDECLVGDASIRTDY